MGITLATLALGFLGEQAFADLAWNAVPIEATPTNLVPLWTRMGGSLDAANPFGSVQLAFDRLPTDPSLAPTRVAGVITPKTHTMEDAVAIMTGAKQLTRTGE